MLIGKTVTVWMRYAELYQLDQLGQQWGFSSRSATLRMLVRNEAAARGIKPKPQPIPQGQMTIFDTMTVDNRVVSLGENNGDSDNG